MFMLSCRDVAASASDYINRDLTWRQRLGVRFHLLMCRFCHRYVHQMRQTVSLLGRIGRTPPSSTLDDPGGDTARDLFRSTRPR